MAIGRQFVVIGRMMKQAEELDIESLKYTIARLQSKAREMEKETADEPDPR